MKQETIDLLNKLSKDDFFKKNKFALIGGTALSIHLNHRLSEDLDFMKLDEDILPLEDIQNLVKKYNHSFIPYNRFDIDRFKNDGEDLNELQQRYYLNNVKTEFITKTGNLFEKDILTENTCISYNGSNIYIANIDALFKQKTLLVFLDRNKIRDMYDLYVMLDKGYFTFADCMKTVLDYRISYTEDIIEKKFQNKTLSIDDEGLDGLIENQDIDFDFLKLYFLDKFKEYKHKKFNIEIDKIDSLINQIKEINLNYKILTIDEFNSKLLQKIDNKEHLQNKYIEFLSMELNTVKNSFKSQNTDNSLENDKSQHLGS